MMHMLLSNNEPVDSPSACQNKPKFWVVVDTRCCGQEIVPGGIARYVRGLCGALAQLFAHEFDHPVQKPLALNLLLVGFAVPPQWVIDLAARYPAVVSYWAYKPSGLSWFPRLSEKPIWLWPSRVWSRVRETVGPDFVWLAPANFDRPLSWFSSARLSSKNASWVRSRSPCVLQLVHDAIPFFYSKHLGFFFSWQFKVRVRRALNLGGGVGVITESHHTQQQLQMLCANANEGAIGVIGAGIEPIFGSRRYLMPDQRQQLRSAFLGTIDSELKEQLRKKKIWILAVGRDEPYKNWHVIYEACQRLNSRYAPADVLIIRVLPCEKKKKKRNKDKQVWSNDENMVLELFKLNDEQLSDLYALADVLLHPSSAEGFGFPPLEAVLSGCPVIFKKGTALDGHVKVLPKICKAAPFWTSLDTLDPAQWAKAITECLDAFLFPKDELAHFLKGLTEREGGPREAMSQALGIDCSWDLVGRRFLELLKKGDL